MQTIWGKTVYESLTELVQPSHTALVLVDVQNDFCHPDGYYGQNGKDLSDIALVVPRIAKLVDAAREAGVLVIWIQQTLMPDARADSPSWLRRRTRGTAAPEWTLEGTWGQDFMEPLRPLPSEPIVKKHRSSSFVGTTLDLILRSNEVESLVICGVVTQGCVESTARDATFFDYYVVMLRDCVGTIDKELHAASMLCQSTRYDFSDSPTVMGHWAAAGRSALASSVGAR
jgi:ureidoacrylate peracid hydrolase